MPSIMNALVLRVVIIVEAGVGWMRCGDPCGRLSNITSAPCFTKARPTKDTHKVPPIRAHVPT